jgi:hypothetical protein
MAVNLVPCVLAPTSYLWRCATGPTSRLWAGHPRSGRRSRAQLAVGPAGGDQFQHKSHIFNLPEVLLALLGQQIASTWRKQLFNSLQWKHWALQKKHPLESSIWRKVQILCLDCDPKQNYNGKKLRPHQNLCHCVVSAMDLWRQSPTPCLHGPFA